MKNIILSIKSFFTFSDKVEETPEIELNKLRNELTNLAIDIGKSYKFNLDYSERSIEEVEKILSDIQINYKETGDEEGLLGISFEFGLYITAVIEKHYGTGKLEQSHKDFGENSFPFYWNGGTLFPCSWCYKRIFDGESDDIRYKYRIFVIDRMEK